jgi:hypothetical protein
MFDLQLMYRECGAETRDDYLRGIANENGLPLECVRRIADRLGEREDFGALVLICESRRGRVQRARPLPASASGRRGLLD